MIYFDKQFFCGVLLCVRVQLHQPKPKKHLFHVPLTKKHRNFDTMGIKVAVLSFCTKSLISREFGLLGILLMPSRSIAHRQSFPRRCRMTAGYRLFLGLPFNLWAIVYLPNANDLNSMKHIKITGNILKTASKSAIIKMVFCTV